LSAAVVAVSALALLLLVDAALPPQPVSMLATITILTAPCKKRLKVFFLIHSTPFIK